MNTDAYQSGFLWRNSMRSLFLSLLVVGTLWGGPPAVADDESIVLNMQVNYGVAYRDGSWVPVDVLVHNSERDVSGSIEVRTYDFNGDVQSPIYRVAAQSPRSSQKRFRLYCKLDRVDRIEARLYHGNRSVTPVPTWLQLSPIDNKDYLGLILDDAYHDYGFLSDRRVIGGLERRFHREGLASEQLGYLADRLPCYTAFDIIVLGDIDPERIGAAQRALLLEYVMLGGTLAVNLGSHADRYVGTWVEPLLGVHIGANEFLSEPEFARAIWPSRAEGMEVTENREGMVTALTPANDTVRPLAGSAYRAGSIHPIGGGQVVTFTSDAVSGLLQHEESYLNLWNHLLLQSMVDRPLNLAAVVAAATQQLPRIAGVRLFPVSSVVIYLLLYFFVAIVANWVFWNRMKRREMAWVCLVFFSVVFTSYAMFFGTQGRARKTQLEQLEILELASNNDTAMLHGISGLLAKGSGQFDANLIYPDTLVTDVTHHQSGLDGGGGIFGTGGRSPFQFVQDDPGRITNLSVGASEMRFIQTETPIRLDGPLEVALRRDAAGLEGTVTNQTGLPLARPVILYDDMVIQLEGNGSTYRIPATTEHSVPTMRRLSAGAALHPGGAQITVDQGEAAMVEQFKQFLAALPSRALNLSERTTPPCFVAWVDGPPTGTLDMGTDAQVQLGASLLIAWLDIEDTRIGSKDPIDLALYQEDVYAGGNYGYAYAGGPVPSAFYRRIDVAPYKDDGSNWQQVSAAITTGNEAAYRLTLPDWVRGNQDYALEITVTTEPRMYAGIHGADTCELHREENYKGGFNLPLVKQEEGRESPLLEAEPEARTIELGPYTNLTQTTYRIKDWNRLLTPRSTTLPFGTQIRADNGRPLGEMLSRTYRREREHRHFHAHIHAQLIHTSPESMGD